jgi:hypothetical protein
VGDSMVRTAATPYRNKPEQVVFGGFGWPEEHERIEACSQSGCVGWRILPTDLYCVTHDRFLPFVRDWANNARIAAILVVAALIYGSFALAAELNSWFPLFVAYAMIGLGALALPLRLYSLTVRTTVLVWFVAYVATLTYHVTGSDGRAILVAILLLAAGCGLGLHVGVRSVQDALDEDVVSNYDLRPRSVLVFVTGILVICVISGVVALSLVLLPQDISAGKSWLVSASLIVAATALALSLLVTVVTGLVDGAPRVSLDTPALRTWRGVVPVSWRARRTAIHPRRVHTVVDRMGDVLRRALIRLADALRISSVAAARTGVNLLLTAVKILVNSLIRCANAVLKVVVILFRGIVAGLASAWWLLSNATRLAFARLGYSMVTIGIPVAAIFVAAGSTSASAGDTLRYLVSGSLVALFSFFAWAILGIVALTISWISLASQRLSPSLRSASRSASITAPYGLLLVAVGGWVVGLPGTFGNGRIHVGWVTIISSCLLTAAFVWSQFINKPQDESEDR